MRDRKHNSFSYIGGEPMAKKWSAVLVFNETTIVLFIILSIFKKKMKTVVFQPTCLVVESAFGTMCMHTHKVDKELQKQYILTIIKLQIKFPRQF